MKSFANQESAALMMEIPSKVSMESVVALWKFSISSSTGRVISDSSGKGLHLYPEGNQGYASAAGATLVVGTPKSYMPLYPCGEIYSNIWHFSGAASTGFTGDLTQAYGGRLQFKMMTSSFKMK